MEKIITLIGIKLARINGTFLFTGPTDECKNCDKSIKSVCIQNLEKGCIYEIINLRDIIHPCAVHEGGVRVVEVQKAPIKVALEAKFVYEGAVISYYISDCDEVSCKNYKYCKPIGIVKEGKYKITRVFGNISHPCSKGKSLKLVELKL